MRRFAQLFRTTALALLLAIISVTTAVAAEVPLRVLTYNIWGRPKPVEFAPWRYAEIAKRIDSYDVIAFQEAWYDKTEVIFNSKTHPYKAYGGNPYGLIGGSGLVVISRYPIVASEFRPFHDCSQWECPANKGVLMFRVRIQPGVEIDFYTAHLNAWDEEDMVRTSQILDLVGMVHDHTVENPVIVLGDFNSDYRSINYDELRANLILRDSYADYIAGLPNPSPEQREGYTFDILKNPWAVPEISGDYQSHRLDYIFYRNAAVRLKPVESSIVFKEAVRDGKPLSDHYGVSTLFSIFAK